MNLRNRKSSLGLFPAKFGKSMRVEQAITQQERRRKSRRRRDTCKFHIDLVMEILIRLPAKSLMRFKCVSKEWSSIISCQYFAKRFYTATLKQKPRLYMSFANNNRQRALLSISPTSPDNTCFVVDQDLSITGITGLLSVASGLICVSTKRTARIYNPTTGQHLTLPAIQTEIMPELDQRKDRRYYIGHDPVNDQYKIVCTICIKSKYNFSDIKSEHWVFVLEAGGSWKKVVVPLECYHPHAPGRVGSFINGSVVHYWAQLNMYTYAVASFDTSSEELTTIPSPLDPMDFLPMPSETMKADLIKYGDKIALFDYTHIEDKGLVYLWVLKDAGKKKWSKKKRLIFQPCQRHLVHGPELAVKGTTQDGRVILVPWKWKMQSEFYIILYDMQLNDLRKVEIKGVPDLWVDKECYSDLKFMDDSESNFCFKSLSL